MDTEETSYIESLKCYKDTTTVNTKNRYAILIAYEISYTTARVNLLIKILNKKQKTSQWWN